MSVQVLVSAVNQEPHALAERMRLRTDAVLINQTDREAEEVFLFQGKEIRCFSYAERGVGRSRNHALDYADREICLFADEDIRYDEGYEDRIAAAFEKQPEADLITFNFRVDASRATYENKAEKRVRWYSYGRYPTFAVAARTEALKRSGVRFSLLFGGGAKYSNGEDSLFLHDCLKKGLRVYASTEWLGEEIFRPSTWFQGYNDKFFFDRGVLYHFLYGRLALLMSIRFLLAHRKVMCGEMGLKKAYRLMKKGIQQGKKE